MDIIDVSPDDLWVPADSLNGRLGEMLGGDCHSDDEALGPIYDINDGWRARDALRRVLAAGERCEACGGSGRITGRVTWPDADCERCAGTGYTRQPHDLGSFIDDEIAGRITPLAAAGLMWASVLRVEAGLGPVCGAEPPWKWHDRYGAKLDGSVLGAWTRSALLSWEDGRWINWPSEQSGYAPGSDAGKAGKLAADTAALSAGFALLNGDHILLPLPDRIARLRLED